MQRINREAYIVVYGPNIVERVMIEHESKNSPDAWHIHFLDSFGSADYPKARVYNTREAAEAARRAIIDAEVKELRESCSDAQKLAQRLYNRFRYDKVTEVRDAMKELIRTYFGVEVKD